MGAMKNLAEQIAEEFASFTDDRSYEDFAGGYHLWVPARNAALRERIALAVSSMEKVTAREVCALVGLEHTRSTRAIVGAALKAFGWVRARFWVRRGYSTFAWFRPGGDISAARVMPAVRALGSRKITSRQVLEQLRVPPTRGGMRRVGDILRRAGWSPRRGSAHRSFWVLP